MCRLSQKDRYILSPQRKTIIMKSIHIALNEDVLKAIEEWNEIYGLNTTAFIRLAVKDKLKKEKLI